MAGKCPDCKGVLNLRKILPGNVAPGKSRRITIPHDIHPLVYLTGKYNKKLRQYGEDLQKIYALIRSQFVHREEYEKQKLILKKQIFTPIIDDAASLPDFSWNLQQRIDLWQLVLTLLPYTYPDKDPDAVFNLYPRYDYAALMCLSYALGGYENVKTKTLLMRKAVRGERSTPKMKQFFNEILKSDYGKEFQTRSEFLLSESNKTLEYVPKDKERDYLQIEEDFNFGFSWAAFHFSGSGTKNRPVTGQDKEKS